MVSYPIPVPYPNTASDLKHSSGMVFEQPFWAHQNYHLYYKVVLAQSHVQPYFGDSPSQVRQDYRLFRRFLLLLELQILLDLVVSDVLYDWVFHRKYCSFLPFDDFRLLVPALDINRVVRVIQAEVGLFWNLTQSLQPLLPLYHKSTPVIQIFNCDHSIWVAN